MIGDRERLEHTFELFEMPEPALERLTRRLHRRRRRQRIAAAATALALVVVGAVLFARLSRAPLDQSPARPDGREGTFSVGSFDPAFSYAGPPYADPETFWNGDDVHIGGTERRARIWVVRDAEMAPRTCEFMQPGTHVRSAVGLLQWVGNHPGLVTSGPVAIQIGGTTGSRVDLQVRPDAPALCRGEVKLLALPGWDYPYHAWSLAPGESARLYVVDVGSGSDAGVVTIVVEAPSERFAEAVAEAEPIVGSITFEDGGGNG